MIYGYCRISRKTQNLERQVRNILQVYPSAIITKEVFTGTKTDGRKGLDKLLKEVKTGDTIIFDSVSRMCRNTAEGVELYFQLYDRGIDLVFLKEPLTNTEVYRQSITRSISIQAQTGNKATDEFTASIINALNKLARDMARELVQQAFEQAQKEVDDLHQRTSEGLKTAKLNGKRVGTPKGSKLEVKKRKKAEAVILKMSKSFGGTLDDTDCMKLTGVSRNTYYKYKSALLYEEECKGDTVEVIRGK